MIKRRIYESNISPKEMSEIFEFFEHNVIDGVKLESPQHNPGVYIREDVEVENLPVEMEEALYEFAQEKGAKVQWSANNAKYTVLSMGSFIDFMMVRGRNTLEFDWEVEDRILSTVRLELNDVVFEADSL